jgi:hypothetical protein
MVEEGELCLEAVGLWTVETLFRGENAKVGPAIAANCQVLALLRIISDVVRVLKNTAIPGERM